MFASSPPRAMSIPHTSASPRLENGSRRMASATQSLGISCRLEARGNMPRTRMRTVCVFTPPITGREVHDEHGVYPLVTLEEEGVRP